MSSSRIECDFLIIGAGVVGLACARYLSRRGQVIVVDPHPSFGYEGSSRNSEVIHSGIYYPKESHKTRLCLQGRELLYRFCKENDVPFQRTGKFVVAVSPTETQYLQTLAKHSSDLGVPVQTVSTAELRQAEPLIEAHAGLFFPESGVVDSHSLMASLERLAQNQGALVAYHHRWVHAESRSPWTSLVESPDGPMEIVSQFLVNAGGMAAAEICRTVWPNSPFTHRFCRGRYFNLSRKYQERFRHLVYPVPVKDGLGVHVTVDLEGSARLGPDVDWATNHHYADHTELYQCDWDALAPSFLGAVQRYCPSIRLEDLQPGLVGIRSKLFQDDSPTRDYHFEIRDQAVHCLGVESPGLTASLAIAEEIENQL